MRSLKDVEGSIVDDSMRDLVNDDYTNPNTLFDTIVDFLYPNYLFLFFRFLFFDDWKSTLQAFIEFETVHAGGPARNYFHAQADCTSPFQTLLRKHKDWLYR